MRRDREYLLILGASVLVMVAGLAVQRRDLNRLAEENDSLRSEVQFHKFHASPASPSPAASMPTPAQPQEVPQHVAQP